jgi:hypothetical protein
MRQQELDAVLQSDAAAAAVVAADAAAAAQETAAAAAAAAAPGTLAAAEAAFAARVAAADAALLRRLQAVAETSVRLVTQLRRGADAQAVADTLGLWYHHTETAALRQRELETICDGYRLASAAGPPADYSTPQQRLQQQLQQAQLLLAAAGIVLAQQQPQQPQQQQQQQQQAANAPQITGEETQKEQPARQQAVCLCTQSPCSKHTCSAKGTVTGVTFHHT